MSRVTLYITEKEEFKSVEDGTASARVHRDRPFELPSFLRASRVNKPVRYRRPRVRGQARGGLAGFV